MKRVLLLALVAAALTACSGGTPPTTTTPPATNVPSGTSKPNINGFSLGSGGLTIYTDVAASCKFSATNTAALTMTAITVKDIPYAYRVTLPAGSYPAATATCTNSAGQISKTFGNLTLGG